MTSRTGTADVNMLPLGSVALVLMKTVRIGLQMKREAKCADDISSPRMDVLPRCDHIL